MSIQTRRKTDAGGGINSQAYFSILGVKITVTNIPQATATIGAWIKQRLRTYVCVAPVATIMDCQRDEAYRQVVNNAGMVTPDGMPVVWLGQRQGHDVLARTYGPDLMLSLCEHGQDYGYRHYFYGGTEATNIKLMDELTKRFAQIKIVGHYAPPFRPVHSQEEKEILDQINDVTPDILWVGLGAPKQDFWMAQHRDQLQAPIMIGVGAAFDFIAGEKKQAPRWMQRSGLEWLFRLGCEPRRLWRRYLLGNAHFILLCIRAYVRHKFGGRTI